MKRVIITVLPILLAFNAVAQKKGKTETKPQPTAEQTQKTDVKPEEVKADPPAMSPLGEHYARKYAIASRWNDGDVAKDALYDLIAEYPGSDSLIFSLALSYFQNQKYPSSVLVCQDLLARNPKSVEILELSAAGYEELHINDRALQNYESIFLLNSSPAALYKMAFLQFQLKRLPESMTNVDILLSKQDVDNLKVIYNTAEGKEKEYKMRVAVLNLKGMIYKEQADKVNAKKFFDESLALAPDFVPAKENVASLK